MLRLLLDSHTLFWAVSDAPALSPRARTMILDQDNEVFYSPVNLYELVFKAHRGRAPEAALRLPEAAIASGFVELGLTSRHLIHAARLDWDHGDPWDRILVAQATLEDLLLVSVDDKLDEQTDRRRW